MPLVDQFVIVLQNVAEEARKTLLTKFPGVLELVSEAATNHITSEELQQHTLSFFTLSLIDSEYIILPSQTRLL